jgi:catechol 2,3-dioxygenase-like lactoylglutathione lyase family enzyme
MSFRSALSRNVNSLQPEYVRREPVGGRDAVFRFSVPVLRVRDVAKTIAWYQRYLGFAAEPFPERAPHEFAIVERDGVQLLVRRAVGATRAANDGHSGWDLYIWVDGVDLGRLEASLALSAQIVRPLTPMGSSMAELEVRDPDGYVLCIGGPIPATATVASPRPSLTEA